MVYNVVTMYVATRTRRCRGKTYTSSQIVEGYRMSDGKVRQRTIVDISKLGPEKIAAVKAALQGKTLVDWEALDGLSSLDWGLGWVTEQTLRRLGFPAVLGKEAAAHFPTLVAMIANRIEAPCAKYALRHWAKKTALAEMLSVSETAFSHKACYRTLDFLAAEQKAIEERLFTLRPEPARLFFYDITSTYFEGQAAELAAFGYSRDHRPDKKQITIGLATDREGLPISVEVFAGNTRDAATVAAKVRELSDRFGVAKACFVGDRGMRTAANIEVLRQRGLDFILALNHREVLALIEKHGPAQMSLFDKQDVAEAQIDGRRLIVCYNPTAAADTKRRREELIALTEAGLAKIKDRVGRGRLVRPEAIQRAADKHFAKWRAEKFFRLSVGYGTFTFEIDEATLEAAEHLDGMYVIETSLSSEELSSQEVQASYKTLAIVERAFRITKDELEIRPVYHFRERRIRGHVFVCFLAYLVEQTFRAALRTLPEAKRPEWSEVLSSLACWRKVTVADQPHLKPKFTGLSEQMKDWTRLWRIELPA